MVKRNRQVLLKEAYTVLGAVLLGEGIIRIIPFYPGFFIAIGMILFIVGVLWKNEKNKSH
ncbi:MAG: hypothetical protein AABX23_00240 [Nanoarchaeota archaeon]